MAKQRGITARDAQIAAAAAVANDPELARRLAAKREERAQAARAMAEESRALLQELASVGHPVTSVWDLADYRDDHPAAVPVLINHLRIPYRGRIREGIGRALGGPSARPYFGLLVDRFVLDPDQDLRRGLAVALARLATEADYPVLESLIRNQSFGEERSFLVAFFSRSLNPQAESLLSDLLADPDLASFAQVALEKRNRKKRKAVR